jgi:hypothetical protein
MCQEKPEKLEVALHTLELKRKAAEVFLLSCSQKSDNVVFSN